MSLHLEKRSMSIAGHRTSIALEPEFWAVLESLAAAERKSLPAFIAGIDEHRAQLAPDRSLASAARVYALQAMRGAAR